MISVYYIFKNKIYLKHYHMTEMKYILAYLRRINAQIIKIVDSNGELINKEEFEYK